MQETFIQAWRALPRFQSRSRFSTWLHRIAVNTVLARRRSLGSATQTGPLEPIACDQTPPLDVEAAIAALPQGARDVLVLVGVYGYSHEEAAALLQIAVGTSKAQLHRARQLLTRYLNEPAAKP